MERETIPNCGTMLVIRLLTMLGLSGWTVVEMTLGFWSLELNPPRGASKPSSYAGWRSRLNCLLLLFIIGFHYF